MCRGTRLAQSAARVLGLIPTLQDQWAALELDRISIRLVLLVVRVPGHTSILRVRQEVQEPAPISVPILQARSADREPVPHLEDGTELVTSDQ